ncbi:hypothetical protein SAMN04487881_1848 [Marinobacter sp. es.048]|uniref:DUF6586 family protein n=1 Tax=Marinobacter sp. es.048 TaxID=1761795 RepID=UPI000B58ADB8|nr:DUF6586 family protein [Marinobacter sp. es.048]SNC67152.1 hypothetical protein SAMN04487881_1848 [Marinobacter sp. es.048]
MASQWHSLVSQKLFLARTLLGQLDQPTVEGEGQSPNEAEQALRREAAIQGAIELLLRSRKLLLVMIARLYQRKSEEPATLDELASMIGAEPNEIGRLRELEKRSGSWWNHMEQLERSQSRPPETKKTVSAENIIAVSADSGPDRSSAALLKTLSAVKHFADDLEDQHSEW